METAQIGEYLDIIDRVGLPLMIIIFLAVVIWRLTPTIKRYIEVTITAKEERAKRDGELNELVRLSNSVIANNTEALKIVNTYNQQAEKLISQHDQDSKERQQRIEAQVSSALNDLDRLITDIKIIKGKGMT
jgi:ABC-type transporter Mla subunit MlaD